MRTSYTTAGVRILGGDVRANRIFQARRKRHYPDHLSEFWPAKNGFLGHAGATQSVESGVPRMFKRKVAMRSRNGGRKYDYGKLRNESD
jgi:hypothetical protein